MYSLVYHLSVSIILDTTHKRGVRQTVENKAGIQQENQRQVPLALLYRRLQRLTHQTHTDCRGCEQIFQVAHFRDSEMKLLHFNLSPATPCPLSGHHMMTTYNVSIFLAIQILGGKQIYLNFYKHTCWKISLKKQTVPNGLRFLQVYNIGPLLYSTFSGFIIKITKIVDWV